MSDAEDDATRGARRAALGAAPWERFSGPPSDYSVHLWQTETAVEPIHPQTAADEESGCHTGGGLERRRPDRETRCPVGRPVHAPPRRAGHRTRRRRTRPAGRAAGNAGHRRPGVLTRGGLGASRPRGGPPSKRLRVHIRRDSLGRSRAENPAPPPAGAAGRALGGGTACRTGRGHDRRGVAMEYIEERPGSTPSAPLTRSRMTFAIATDNTGTKTS